MKRKQTISIGIALAFSITTLKLDKVEANPITAPACKDVPSCIVTGTVVVGGIVYYVIKNTVTGVTRRVPAKQEVPSHRSTQSGDYENAPVGQPITTRGLVKSQEDCNKRARHLTEEGFGEWEALRVEKVESNAQTDDLGRIGTPEFSPLYICKVKKVR